MFTAVASLVVGAGADADAFRQTPSSSTGPPSLSGVRGFATGALRAAESESPRDGDPRRSSESLADSTPFGSRATAASGFRRTEREDVLGDALRSALSSRSRLLPPKPDPAAVSRSFTRSTISTPASRSSLSVSLGEAAPGAARVEQLTSSASSSDPITSTRSELVVSIDARARGAAGGFARLVCARGRGRVGGGRGGGSAAIVEGGGDGRQRRALSLGGTTAARFALGGGGRGRRARIDPIWTRIEDRYGGLRGRFTGVWET